MVCVVSEYVARELWRFGWDGTQRLDGALDKQVWVVPGLGGIERRG